ncbi:hypothetical protein Tco_1271683 [Tanacetum coccineum]
MMFIQECCEGQDMALPPRNLRHQYLRGLLDLMAEGLSARMLMKHRDAQGVWRGALGLYTAEEMHTVGFGAYYAKSARQIPDKRDLRDYWIGISSAKDFLGIASPYTAIQDPILRLCHRLIACSIAGRSQAPKKVTMTDLFYLRGMDVGSVNVPYLLARYLRLFAAGRKSRAHISGGQFVARLAEHFGLLTVEILQGLTVIAPELPIIDMAELVRLQICMEIDDTWAWVAIGLERLEEDVHEIRGALAKQRGVIGAMAKDFSRFTVWAASGMAQLLDSARVTYTPYFETRIPYQRRVRRSTGEASTSTAQQDQQQPDL